VNQKTEADFRYRKKNFGNKRKGREGCLETIFAKSYHFKTYKGQNQCYEWIAEKIVDNLKISDLFPTINQRSVEINFARKQFLMNTYFFTQLKNKMRISIFFQIGEEF